MNFLEELKKQGEKFRDSTRRSFEDENICETPGLKIRSKGKGRGLAFGKGRGPIGIPYGEKEEE